MFITPLVDNNEDIAELIDSKTMNIAPLLEKKRLMLKSETIGFFSCL